MYGGKRGARFSDCSVPASRRLRSRTGSSPSKRNSLLGTFRFRVDRVFDERGDRQRSCRSQLLQAINSSQPVRHRLVLAGLQLAFKPFDSDFNTDNGA